MVVLETIGVKQLHEHGLNGHGVGVAVLDTGVTPVFGLAGRVRTGVNLSGAGHPSDTTDEYGHGTFEAGLIAGDLRSSPRFGEYEGGVAPGAHIVPIKVAAPDGSTDLSTVLAGLQWAVAHKDELGIQVLNLSYGTDSALPWEEDPFNYAIERVWSAGIVVVIAAGNREGPDTIRTPADDPWAITVGATETQGTGTILDDELDEQSASGSPSNVPKPDVVAPGEQLVSYRAPNSFIAAMFQGGRRSEEYQRGTGTSHATALVSGAVALLKQRYPTWTPAQVKAALLETARPLGDGADGARAGRGLIDVAAAAGLDEDLDGYDTGLELQLSGRPLRDLDEARDSRKVQTYSFLAGPQQAEYLEGARTTFGREFDPQVFQERGWTREEWEGSWARLEGWTTTQFAEDAWTGHGWTGHGWTGHGWTGHGWTGHGWTGHGWTGHGWTGHGWTGHGWTGHGWTGGRWWGYEWT